MKKRLLFLLLSAFVQAKLSAQDLGNLGNQKPINFTGSIQARSIFYNVSGISARRQPFNYYLTGSPTVSLYGIDVPISFTLSKSDKSFSQPFNQFGMSPTYKWITIHAGYRNVSFSPYTLGGHTMLGAGIELNPGKLRAGFMYGRLNRATTIDTTTQALVPYSFSRKGYAAKLGYGTSNNFFELSYLSAQDDSTTKPVLPDQRLNYISPAKNNVLGYTARFSFFKHFTFETDGAGSIYTNDITSKIHLEKGKSELLDRVSNIFRINGTTEIYTALSAGLGYRAKNYGLKVNYKRIDPDFQTMGAYYFSSDLENWTFNPSAVLLNGKIRFNGSLGFQHDNLKEQKRAQNRRVIGSANAGVDFTKSFSVDVIYTNFSDNQKAQTVYFADSLKIVQTTRTTTVMPRYIIINPDVIHIISASVSVNSLNDFNTYYSADAVSRNIKTSQYFLNYNITFPKRQVSGFVSFSNTKLTGQGMNNTYSSASLGGNLTSLKQRLQTGLSSTFTSTKDAGGSDAFIINASGNVIYRVTAKQLIGFNFFLTNNKAKRSGLLSQPNFTETRGELTYTLNF